MKNHNQLFSGIISSIIGIILTIIFFNIMLHSNNMKFIMLPFIIISIIIFLKGIIDILNDFNINSKKTDIDKIGNFVTFQKIQTTSLKVYQIVFFTFWFIILIICDIEAILAWNNGGIFILIFSLIFWIVGIISIINLIKKNK